MEIPACAGMTSLGRGVAAAALGVCLGKLLTKRPVFGFRVVVVAAVVEA
jgi:hypothetical protein